MLKVVAWLLEALPGWSNVAGAGVHRSLHPRSWDVLHDLAVPSDPANRIQSYCIHRSNTHEPGTKSFGNLALI